MPPPIAVLPDPEPVQALPVQWRVLTQDELPAGNFQVFALDTRNYENLSLNMADTIRWIREAREALRLYREALGNAD